MGFANDVQIYEGADVTKRELVIEVAERLGFTQNEVADVVQATLDSITESLSDGNRLEIRNFGVFEYKVRDARIGRNPRTGEAVPIEEKRVVVFKPGKSLKARVEKDGVADKGEGVPRLAAPASPVRPTDPPEPGEQQRF